MLIPITRIRGPRTDHPILHGEPLTPSLLRALNLCELDFLEGFEKGDRFMGGHVVVAFDLGPADAFRGEEVVAALALVHGTDAFTPVLAEEAVHDACAVHAGDNEAADKRDERDPGWRRGRRLCGVVVVEVVASAYTAAACYSNTSHTAGHARRSDWALAWPPHVVSGGARGMRQRARGAEQRVLRPLEGQADVDEGAHGLDAIVVLGVVEEVALAALVCGVPFENVKVRFGRRLEGRWSSSCVRVRRLCCA